MSGSSQDHKKEGNSDNQNLTLSDEIARVFSRLVNVAKELSDKRQDSSSTANTEDESQEEVNTKDSDLALKAVAKAPEFESELIAITYEDNATRYSDAVCPWGLKMLTALGVKPSDCDSIALSSKDRKILCDKALEHLLIQTKDCTAKYVTQFEDLIAQTLNSKFEIVKLSLENVLKNDE